MSRLLTVAFAIPSLATLQRFAHKKRKGSARSLCLVYLLLLDAAEREFKYAEEGLAKDSAGHL